MAVYNIGITVRAKKALDEARRTDKRYRTDLSRYFHADYSDTRSPQLKQAGAWAVQKRPFRTTVVLNAKQVLSILDLAERHDIDIQYSNKIPNPTFLLGTFLSAVLVGDLTPTDINDPKGPPA